MRKPEVTSKRIASIAGSVQANIKKIPAVYKSKLAGIWHGGVFVVSVRDLKALAASALTQAPDKKK